MDFEYIFLFVILVLAAVLACAFHPNPLMVWTRLITYFGKGPEDPNLRSRVDRQRSMVSLICFLVFIGLPAAVLIWFTYSR